MLFLALTFHTQRPECCGEILWQFCLQQEEERARAGDPTGLHIIWNSEICGERLDTVQRPRLPSLLVNDLIRKTLWVLLTAQEIK